MPGDLGLGLRRQEPQPQQTRSAQCKHDKEQCTLVCPIRRPQCNAKSDPAPRWTRSPSGGPSVGDSRGDGSRCLVGPCRGQADRTTSVTPKSPTQRDVLPITAFGVP